MSFVKIFAIIVYGFFALVIISTIVYYFRFQKVNQIRKRLSKNESLKEKEDNNLFDFLINKYNRFIKLCNNILSKSVLLTNYSNYYKKYINKDDKDSSPMTFISIKVLLMQYSANGLLDEILKGQYNNSWEYNNIQLTKRYQEYIIYHSLLIKKKVVEKDEKENSLRRVPQSREEQEL